MQELRDQKVDLMLMPVKVSLPFTTLLSQGVEQGKPVQPAAARLPLCTRVRAEITMQACRLRSIAKTPVRVHVPGHPLVVEELNQFKLHPCTVTVTNASP
jgi:hypothetical protein